MSSRSFWRGLTCSLALWVGCSPVGEERSESGLDTTIALERGAHFFTPDGEDILVEPGSYRLEAEAETALRLVAPENAAAGLVVAAEIVSHDLDLIEPQALSVADEDNDEHELILLQPNGESLVAMGSYSGVRERGRGSKLASAQRARARRAMRSRARRPSKRPTTRPRPKARPSRKTPSRKTPTRAPQIDQTKLRLAAKPRVPYRAFRYADFARGVANVNPNSRITLPNKKRVPLREYVKVLNTLEKNLSRAGYSTRTMKARTRLASYKGSPAVRRSPKLQAKGRKLTGSALDARFTADEYAIPRTRLKTRSLYQTTAQQRRTKRRLSGDITRIKVGTVPRPTTRQTARVNRENGFDIEQSIQGFTARILIDYHLKATAHPATTPAEIESSDSSYSMGLTVVGQTKLPADVKVGGVPLVGDYLDLYRYEANYTARSNKNANLTGNSLVKVLDRVLIDERFNRKRSSYQYKETRVTPIKTGLGTGDLFMFGLNAFMPTNFLGDMNAGGSVDVKMDRANVEGHLGPTFSQVMRLEAGVADLVGVGLVGDVLDLGVGGALDLVAGTFAYGGKVGLHFSEGTVILNDDIYFSIDLELVRGRLYWYYRYPYFRCDNIFTQALDPNCWAIRSVEHDLVNTGALYDRNFVVVDDDKSKALDW